MLYIRLIKLTHSALDIIVDDILNAFIWVNSFVSFMEILYC